MNILSLNETVVQAGQVVGYLITFAVVFGETGTLIGSVLPGDTFLFGLGLAASQGLLSMWILVPLCLIAGITGDMAGYWFGTKVGAALYSRPDTRFVKKAHLERARDIYLEKGASALIIARFTPIIRSLAPIIAGISGMPYRQFALYNVVGAALWVISMLYLGYFLGAVIPNIDHWILPIVGIIIIISVGIGYREISKSTKK